MRILHTSTSALFLILNFTQQTHSFTPVKRTPQSDLKSNLNPPSTLHPWTGLAGIKHAFFFGDSYSTIRYDINSSPHPSPTHPLGLPYPGLPSSNGPNWISYLTAHHNASTILTFVLAFGGATISRTLIPPFESYIWDLDTQITHWSRRLCGGKWYGWKPESSLAGFWFGVNDVWRSYPKAGLEGLYGSVMEQYERGWERVRGCGVGGMVVLNLPPLHLSPSGLALPATDRKKLKEAVTLFNVLLADRVEAYRASSPGMHVFAVNTNRVFEDVIRNKERWGFEEAGRSCRWFGAFKKGGDVKEAEDGGDERCSPKEVRKWVWRDGLHPGSGVHWFVGSAVGWGLG